MPQKKAPATPATPATEAPTDVIFRVFLGKDGGDVIAIFPGEPGTYSAHTCESYQHVGQHGACNPYALMAQGTRPATPEEYAPLLQELQAIGYTLRIVKRHTQKHRAARVHLLART